MSVFCRSRHRLLHAGRSFSSLPVVNLAPFLEEGSPHLRSKAARSLDDACRSVGFFYLEGHGVPAESQQQMHHLAKEFFTLPAASKEAVALSTKSFTARGYQRLGENVTQKKRDWHEAIDFYAEPSPSEVDLGSFIASPANMHASQLEEVRAFVHGRNLWPSEPVGFQRHVEAYFEQMQRVGNGLMDAMAVAMGLPEAYFRELTNRSFWCARVIGYPPLAEGPEAVGLSCGEHSDYGCWTILSQDDTPDALEVQLRGGWVKVQPRAGAFVINLGDMLSVWTKGRYVATRHRVRQTSRKFRTSIAYFHEPNFDAVIKPLDVSCGQSGCDPPPASVVASTKPLQRGLGGGTLIYGEHLFAKVSTNFLAPVPMSET